VSDACAIEMFLFFNILIIYLFLFFGNSGGSRPAEVSRTVDGRLLGCSGTDTQSGLNLGVTDVGQVQLAVIVLTIFIYRIFFWFGFLKFSILFLDFACSFVL